MIKKLLITSTLVLLAACQPALPPANTEPVNSVDEALLRALDDEYKAKATYQAVLDKFGSDTRPFSNIINAEDQHISELVFILTEREVDIPENPYLGKITAPATVQQACDIGVTAEKENAALYNDILIPAVENEADIKAAFERLRDASQNNHLRAFERCASR